MREPALFRALARRLRVRCVARMALLGASVVAICGCVPHRVYTQALGVSFVPRLEEREEVRRGLVIALYSWQEVPPIDYGGPYGLRARVVKPSSSEAYNPPLESYVGNSLVFPVVIIHPSIKPEFYVFLPDGRHGYVTDKDEYGQHRWTFRDPMISRTADQHGRSSELLMTTDQRMQSFLYVGLLKCEPRENDPGRPYIRPEEAAELCVFIQANPGLFTDKTHSLANRLRTIELQPPTADEYTEWAFRGKSPQ